MTIWHENTDINALKNRLGNDVFMFLYTIGNNRAYLSDHYHLLKKVKPAAEKWQLSDYSPFVLHICKFFENSLFQVCEELCIFKDLRIKKPYSLRAIFDNHRKNIQEFLREKVKNQKKANAIIDKLFSTVEDYNQRNKVVHPGKLLKYEEIENYDSYLSKLKELVDLLIEQKLIIVPKSTAYKIEYSKDIAIKDGPSFKDKNGYFFYAWFSRGDIKHVKEIGTFYSNSEIYPHYKIEVIDSEGPSAKIGILYGFQFQTKKWLKLNKNNMSNDTLYRTIYYRKEESYLFVAGFGVWKVDGLSLDEVSATIQITRVEMGE